MIGKLCLFLFIPYLSLYFLSTLFDLVYSSQVLWDYYIFAFCYSSILNQYSTSCSRAGVSCWNYYKDSFFLIDTPCVWQISLFVPLFLYRYIDLFGLNMLLYRSSDEMWVDESSRIKCNMLRIQGAVPF